MEVKEFAEKDDLDAFLTEAKEKGMLVVVDFHAQWCGPCKMIAPKIVTMADEMKEYCWFCKVDVDEAEQEEDESDESLEGSPFEEVMETMTTKTNRCRHLIGQSSKSRINPAKELTNIEQKNLKKKESSEKKGKKEKI